MQVASGESVSSSNGEGRGAMSTTTPPIRHRRTSSEQGTPLAGEGPTSYPLSPTEFFAGSVHECDVAYLNVSAHAMCEAMYKSSPSRTLCINPTLTCAAQQSNFSCMSKTRRLCSS